MTESEIKKRKGAAASSSSSSSTSSSSSSSSSSNASVDPFAGTGHWGFTDDGTRFEAPETLNTMEVFLPQNLSVGSVISATCFLLSAYLVFFGGFSKWLHIGIFFFWRTAYDLGLGLILRAQSEHKSFYKFYLKLYGDGTGGWAKLFDHLAARQLHRRETANKRIQDFPPIFRAWLVYKNFVSIILVNDGLTYLLLGLKCFHAPPDWSLSVLAQYLIGFFLCIFNWWAKVDAHRCIGSYSWFWGDFFFRKDLHLTFDGIFELFPHPMYTVGYSLYYGYSLIARSYTMLFVSLIAHGMQLAFLFFVEEPHIKRTYGSPAALDKSKSRILYDPKSGLFPDKNDNVFLSNFDLFRSGDFSVFFFSIYGVAIAFLPSDPVWGLWQCILWRVIHWVGLGTLLWAQSSFQLWTRHFTTRGRTLFEAFGHWKNTYNLSLTMNIVVIIACALRYVTHTFTWKEYLLNPFTMASAALGLVLIGLSIWSYTSTYEAVGEFGWFYGDFFISGDAYKQQLCYTGIYRFINNPDCVTGYAGQYGLALMAQSWPIFFLALGTHIANILFLNLVEIPHMNKLYGQREIRDEAPFPKALKRIQKRVLPGGLKLPQQIEKNFKGEVKKIRSRAMEEVWQVYKKLSDSRKSLNGDVSSAASLSASPNTRKAAAASTSTSTSNGVTISTPSHITLGDSLTIKFSASVVPREQADDSSRPRAAKLSPSKSSYDWIGVYPVEVNSAPGASDGKWVYVEPTANGEIVFPATLLPAAEGVYEARYHRNNSYQVVASHPFIMENADELEASPEPSPTEQSEAEQSSEGEQQ